jgi:uncharacterized protein YciI
MLFAVLFDDNPAADPGIRESHMAAHLAFLEAQGGAVAAAGPLHGPDGEGAGGMWLVEAEGAEAVERLIRADPFWRTGLRRSHRILAWSRVFADGGRLIDPG